MALQDLKYCNRCNIGAYLLLQDPNEWALTMTMMANRTAMAMAVVGTWDNFSVMQVLETAWGEGCWAMRLYGRSTGGQDILCYISATMTMTSPSPFSALGISVARLVSPSDLVIAIDRASAHSHPFSQCAATPYDPATSSNWCRGCHSNRLHLTQCLPCSPYGFLFLFILYLCIVS